MRLALIRGVLLKRLIQDPHGITSQKTFFKVTAMKMSVPGNFKFLGHVVQSLNVHRLLVGKPEGKRSLGRPRRRCLDNIKTDLLEIRWSVVDWIGLAQDRYRWRALVNSVMNLWVP
jgi:hypothetical protein